jgi:hypothetical protein
MSKQKIKALRQALGGPPGPHLDQELLAEVATAEVAGEPVETQYAAALAHLEHCLTCAEAYSELVTMALTAAEGMASAAMAVPAEAVYAALLQQAAADTPAPIVAAVVAQLPLHFTAAPDSAADISEEWVQAAVSPHPTAATWVDRLLPAIRQQLPALRLYLEQAGAAAWEQIKDWQIEVNGRPLPLQLALPSSLREEHLPYTTGQSITVELTRLSPLAGRLTVRLYPGDTQETAAVFGRVIALDMPHGSQTITTNEHGLAHFEPIPIPALPHIKIRLTV